MRHEMRSVGFAAAFGLAAMMLVLAVACGDDDDAYGAGAGTGESSSGGSGDAITGTGGAGAGGTAGTSGGTVTEGGVCTLGGGMPGGMPGATGTTGGGTTGMTGTTSLTGNGTCQQPTDPCEGGTMDDIAAAFESFLGSTTLPIPVDASAIDFSTIMNPAGDCVSGLICCISPNQCDSMRERLSASPFAANAQISCVAQGSCGGIFAIPVGCPGGSECCIQFSMPDGGIPLPPTAGMPAGQQ